MNTLNTFKRTTLSGALLSATLAGGLFAYSAVADTAGNNPGQGAQANAGQPMTNQQQANTQNNNQQNNSQQNTGRQLTDTQQRGSSDQLSDTQQSSQQGNNQQMQQRSAASAQGDNRQQQNPSMSDVDQNSDAELVWTEIYAIYDEELDDAGWTETSVLGAYDEDASASLDAAEYVIFVSGLTDASGTQGGGTSAGAGQQNAAAGSTSTGDNQQAMQDPQQQQGQDAAPATVVSVLTVAETGLAPAEIEDREVVNYNNDSIGDVEEVVTAPDGTITGLVVGVGGFWGIGEKDVFVPVDEVKAYGDKIVWETFLGEEQLEELPQYEAEAYTAN